MVIGCVGGASAYALSDGVLTNLSRAEESDSGHISVARAPIGAGDCLVLLGHEVSSCVEEKELRQTVQASFSVEDAAAWLVTLAAGRSGKAASAVVAQVQSTKAPKTHFAEGIHEPRRLSVPRVNLKMAGFAVAGIAVLIVALIAANTLPKSLSSSANSLLPVKHLTVVSNSPHSTLLSWNAAAGSTGYVVRIDGRTFSTRAINLPLNNLTPGEKYAWQVRTLYGSQRSGWTVSTVHVSLAAPLAKPVAVSPAATVPAIDAGNVHFCWTIANPATSYDLMLSGGHKKYNQTPVPPNKTKAGAHGGRCVVQSLPAATTYSWRVGAVSPGHWEAWTPWRHFVLEAAPTPVPTAAATTYQQYPVYSTPVPTTAPYTTTTGSTASQPSTTTQQAPAQSSSGSVGGSSSAPAQSAPAQPAPTSPVTACSNPPNC